MKKITIVCLIALASLNVRAQSYVVIAGDNVCLRFRADESTKWTGSTAPHFFTGDKLTCIGKKGNYYKVKYNDDYYYVPTRYARPRGVQSSGNPTTKPVSYNYIIIAGDNVCFRTKPNEQSKVMGNQYKHLFTGDVLRCVGETGNYYKIIYGDEYYYIPKQYGRPRY